MYSSFWFTDTYKILTGSSVEPVLSLASRIEALALPDKSKRATPKTPRQCKYIVCPLANNRKSIEDIENVYNTPHKAFFVALFLTCRWICEIPIRQNQSVQKRLLSICMYTPPLPIGGFRYGDTQQRYEKYFNVSSTNSRYLYCVWENNKAISWRAYCISWSNKDIELSARDGTFLGGIPSEKGFGLKKSR